MVHGMLKMAMAAGTCRNPSTKLPSWGAPMGIFRGQKLAGEGAIIARIRRPVSRHKEEDLRPTGEVQATDVTREALLAVVRCDR